MPPKERKQGSLASSLQILSLDPAASTRSAAIPAKPASKSKPRTSSSFPLPFLADSWEEEAALSSSSGSSSRVSSPNPAHHHRPSTPTSPLSTLPLAPPPTPITGTHHRDWTSSSSHAFRPSSGTGGVGCYQQTPPQARPEKQTAVAGRMIAGALGVRAPPKSQEGKRYERVLREKAGREREEKKREEEERERAKKAVWDS